MSPCKNILRCYLLTVFIPRDAIFPLGDSTLLSPARLPLPFVLWFAVRNRPFPLTSDRIILHSPGRLTRDCCFTLPRAEINCCATYPAQLLINDYCCWKSIVLIRELHFTSPFSTSSAPSTPSFAVVSPVVYWVPLSTGSVHSDTHGHSPAVTSHL